MNMCKELYEFMSSRHNIEPNTLDNMLSNSNNDYSMTPLPVLLQPSILLSAIEQIQHYNDMKGTDYGFNPGSILSLVQIKKKKKGDIKYKSEFQLEGCDEGSDFLIKLLTMIEDSLDPNNKNTIMRMIETTQRKYGMEPTTKRDPKLFLVFLPMGQSIDTLQKTLMSFIKKHKLWGNYYVDYSNSNSESENGEKEFMKKVDKSMELAKQQKKKGCILLLGNQGKLGITYPKCDVTIHLDNGTNIDDAKQTYYRSLTEREGKTIGINVDLNIQRVYMYVMNRIREYKKVHNDNRSYSEILQYLFTENQFIFNPSEFGFDGYTAKMIDYFDKYEERLKQEISIDSITENIVTIDDLHKLINKVHLSNGSVIVNSELNGNQTDCPQGKKTKEQVDSIESSGNTSIEGSNEEEPPDQEETNGLIQVNKTKKLYEYLTKLCCLLLRKDRINPDNNGKDNRYYLNLIKSKPEYSIIQKKLMNDFDILETDLNIIFDRYIDTMSIDVNQDILTDIFDIYARSRPEDLRKIIEKHFIPTSEQRKKHAEIPTPVECVDEMIDKLPPDYFKKQKKTLEPCCGKGNFVLAIFEKFFDGLSHIKDEIERCRIIIEECLYFADLDPINIYITKELLICHALYKLREGTWNDWNKVLQICDFKYNTYIGDTLELDIKILWGSMDAVIFNPPYNSEGGLSKGGKNLYNKFIVKSFEVLEHNGYSLFIVPTGCLKTTVYDKKTPVMDYMLNNEIIHININECAKYFNVGSTFTYLLIKNNQTKYIHKVVSNIKGKLYHSSNIDNIQLNFIPLLCDRNTLNIINKSSYNNLNIQRVDSTDKFIYDKFIYIKRLDHINHKNPHLKVHIGDKTLKIKGPILYMEYNENIKKILESNLYAFLNIITRYDGVIYHKLMNMFGYPNIDGVKINNNQDVYKLFKLSVDEITHIENILN